MSIWFDSRDLRYKDPFGAVSCGAEVRFALGADEPLEECCLLYTSPSPRDSTSSRMPSSA